MNSTRYSKLETVANTLQNTSRIVEYLPRYTHLTSVIASVNLLGNEAECRDLASVNLLGNEAECREDENQECVSCEKILHGLWRVLQRVPGSSPRNEVVFP